MHSLQRWPQPPSFNLSRVSERISAIFEDPDLGSLEKVHQLERMREGASANMRAATKSVTVDDNGVGDHLKQI